MHRDMQERGARDKAFSTHGGSRCARTETAGAGCVDGSKGIAPDFLEDLEKREKGMTKHETKPRPEGGDFFVIRASSLFRHSSLVIRHFSRPPVRHWSFV